MGRGAATSSPGIAGRIGEREVLGTAMRGAIEGRPCAVFVHGEAGVGKTRLVRAVCDDVADRGVAVLWGRCVRFGAVDSPYGPLVSALEGWAESAESPELAEVVEAVPAAAEVLPALGGRAFEREVRLLSVLDALVMAIARYRPTILIVDDVQWADPASRDALAYLVAGFRSQRLAMLATYRDEELVTGHPLHGWLADLRRLPSVSDVRLDRLSRDETEQQIATLLGGRPRPRLVDEVVRRSEGNPYLTELLLEGVTVTADALPAGLPAELTGALLAAWHRLPAAAREVMRLLAVAGRPASIDDLIEVAAACGIGPGEVTGALAAATNTGISVAQDAETCWFRHPLLAEVLYATFVPGEAGPMHAAWATVLEAHPAAGLDEVQRQGDLALHYEAAHDLAACLEASLRAADLAGAIKARREEAVHLRRATRLWPAVHAGEHPDEHADEEVGLLERVARANDLAGDGEASFRAWSRAVELVDERTDPLRACRLLRRWADAAWATGRTDGRPVAEALHALELSAGSPDSEEYAEALAFLAWCQWWNNEPQLSGRYAEEVVQAAHRSGSKAALSLAYAVRGNADVHGEGSDHDTATGLRLAEQTGEPDLIWRMLVIRQNYLTRRGRLLETVEPTRNFLAFALDEGALSVAAFAAGLLSHHLLMLGRLPESADVLREGLSLAGLPNAGAMVRLSAASLAVRQGSPNAAGQHVRRAKELMPDLDMRAGLFAQPVLAEYLLTTGRAEQALDLLRRTIATQYADTRDADEMLVWGARVAADLMETARDRRDHEAEATTRAAFDELLAVRRGMQPPPFEPGGPTDLIQPAMQALFTAERARYEGGSQTSGHWAEAVRRCAVAGLRWDEAVASWRWAQALHSEGGSRNVVAEPLRSAYRFAADVSAVPLREQVEALAALGGIPLQEPALPDDVPERLRSLTQREREVLAHLVAGRTYGEIAKALFISEKTVSVHVSNLLHKTGTSSRREVAALAIRLGRSTSG
ncbi:helix-turn-helix transcriptional regulator [Kribbella sp. CA-247076]|uniref:helix-turn-helix transcriptional regulator n=1 Tax=Kribbella sp. CA-247076 TaxID=3239941 RepID=UPI003D8EE5D9